MELWDRSWNICQFMFLFVERQCLHSKGPYPLEQLESADSRSGDSVGGQILNMFTTDCLPTIMDSRPTYPQASRP